MPRKEFESFTRLDASDVNTYLMDQSVMTFGGTAARGSAIPTPVEGMVTYLEDSNTLQLYDGSGWTSAGGVSSGNAIINGAFEINQRNFTSSTTTQTYGFDRFVYSYTGGTATYSAQTFTPGAAPVAGYEARNFARVATIGQSASGDFAFLSQRVEDVRTFAGQTATISVWAKASSGTPNIGVALEQNFGAGGSSLVPINAGVKSITTSWERYSFTVTIPSIAGKTIGTNPSLVVGFLTSAGTDLSGAGYPAVGLQNNTIDIWGVQLEAGPTANVFRRNANSLQGELAACQRYYYRDTATSSAFTWFGTTGIAASTTSVIVPLKTPVPLRTIASSVEFSTLLISDTVNNTAVTSVTLDTNRTADTSVVSIGVASGLTQFRPYILRANNSTSAFIGLSAEL
jgi:hypothetical protein